MSAVRWPYWLRFAVMVEFMCVGGLAGWIVGTRGSEWVVFEVRVALIALGTTLWIPAVLAWQTGAEQFGRKLAVVAALALYLGWEVQRRSVEFAFNPMGLVC